MTLLTAERGRAEENELRVAEFRRRFVEEPVLILPRIRRSSSRTAGRTALPGVGTIFPSYRATPEWGELEADWVLVSDDTSRVVLTAPIRTEGQAIEGEGWKLRLDEGWTLRPGPRAGDYELVRAE